MRLFLIWATEYSQIEPLVLRLREKGHQILYWLGAAGQEGKIPGAIFHSRNDALETIPAAGVPWEEFPPVGRDLIERFYKTESLILTMMNKYFDKICVDERKHIYYTMLGYWHGVLCRYKPEVIIFPVYPHSVYNYIIYELAKALGIKTIMFDDCWFGHRLLLLTDWREGSSALREAIKNNRDKTISLTDLNKELQEYYLTQTSGQSKASELMPTYTNYWQRRYAGMRNSFCRRFNHIFLSIKKGTVFQDFIRSLGRHFKPNLKKDYLKLQSKFEPARDFIYVPLAYQPEASTSPLGEMFCDQLLMVEILAASLPHNWVIYVKEHPAEWWVRGEQYSSHRYQGYYQRLASLKNVYLTPIKTNHYALIERSRAVATVTGTAGWEALLRSKPAIVFGYPWYRDCPALFKADGVESCKAALTKIVAGFRPEPEQIINFLKSYQEAGIPGCLEPLAEEMENLNVTQRETMNNIAQAILSAIDNTT